MAKLHVDPASSLIDEKNVITLSGLDKQQAVTLYAQLRGEDQTLFHSSAHYIANEAGRVVLDEQPSLGGSYTGLHPMGVLWSLELGPDGRKGFRLFKRDVTIPYEVNLKALRGHLSKEECLNTSQESENVLAECKFHKWYMGPNVQRIPVKEGRIRGALFLPPGHGPFPGVIAMYGTSGGLTEFTASLLASHGFASLALAYFRYDDLPASFENLEMEYFEEALLWFMGHPKVQPGGVGIHALCKGADIAVALASLRHEISAVVAIGTAHGISACNLSYRGKILKSIPIMLDRVYRDQDNVLITKHCYDNFSDDLGTPIEDIKGEVLIIVGEDDQSLTAVAHKNKILERSTRHGKRIQVLSYPGAGHVLEPPYTPLCAMSFHAAVNQYIMWGGEAAAHAHAQEDNWNHVIRFLKANVPRKSRL